MTFWSVSRAFVVILIMEVPYQLVFCLDKNMDVSFQAIKNVEKRSLLTFPPDSLLQINVGITLAGHLDKNTASIALSFQQNALLPNETQPLVVSGRKFSIFGHLRDVIDSYGLNGSECLKKMICEINETPLFGGLMEELINFVLSPSKHRILQNGDMEEMSYIDSLLESERLGKFGENCSFAFPQCLRTPLDFVSTFIRA